MSDLDAAIAANKAALAAMSPVDRALHDSDQRRSWLRGMTGREPPRDVLADEVRRLREELAAREAAAFKRGAEAMRTTVVAYHEGQWDYCEARAIEKVSAGNNADALLVAQATHVKSAAAIRALPIPEDKA